MCMGKKGDLDVTKKVFRELRNLTDHYDLQECSMGMSGDWSVALEEGSTMLRIGRLVFDDQASN